MVAAMAEVIVPDMAADGTAADIDWVWVSAGATVAVDTHLVVMSVSAPATVPADTAAADMTFNGDSSVRTKVQESTMRHSTLTKILIVAVALVAFGATTIGSSLPAVAQGGHSGGGGHGGGFGGHGGGFGGHGDFGGGHGFFGGYGYGYGYPAYGYYTSPGYDDDCYWVRQRVIGRYGRVFTRRVQVCD